MNKESFKYQNDIFHFKLGKYGNGVLAVQVLNSSDSPYCTLSVNLEGTKPSEGCFWLKDWSENADIATYLQDNDLIELTGRAIKTGFVSAPEARITQKGLTASLIKEGATYDSWETDQIMTDELSHRDDYGERSKGQYFHDYPENSSDVRPPARPQHQQEQWNTKSPQSKTLAEYFKQWAKERWEKIIGKELQEGGHPFDPSLSEGYWNKPLPYTGTEGTPTSFMMMPAMKVGALSPEDEEAEMDLDLEWKDFITRDEKTKKETKDYYIKYRDDRRLNEIFPRKLRILRQVFPDVEKTLLEKYRSGPNIVCQCTHRKSDHSDVYPHPCGADDCSCKYLMGKSFSGYQENENIWRELNKHVKKEAINMYGDHHVEITFEFSQDEIRVMCTWETGDLPKGLDEAQTLARIVQFLEKKLPPTFDRFKHIRLTDVDLSNRTISFEIPTTSLRMQ